MATGLQKHTVQEATNLISQRAVIRVNATLAAAAISGTAGDVLINRQEIPNAVLNPGGCSGLTATYLVDYDDVTTDEDFVVIFHQVSAADFGTADATANISDANIKLSKLLGLQNWDNSSSSTVQNIDNARFLQLEPSSGGPGSVPSLLLQAEEGSTSVYFSVIQTATSGATPDWDTGDLEFVFHIEY